VRLSKPPGGRRAGSTRCCWRVLPPKKQDVVGSHGAGRAHQLTPAGARRGPTGTLLNELAEASHEPANCEVMFVRGPPAQSSDARARTL